MDIIFPKPIVELTVLSKLPIFTICFKGVMTGRWQKRSSLLSFLVVTLILSITHRWEYLCGSPWVQSTVGAKKSENRCIEEFKRSNFTLPISSLSQGGMTQCLGRSPQHTIFLIRESERCGWMAFPDMQDAAQKVPFFLTLPRLLRWSARLRG